MSALVSIPLLSACFEVERIVKKTKTAGLASVKQGDVIQLRTYFQNGHGRHAAEAQVINHTQQTVGHMRRNNIVVKAMVDSLILREVSESYDINWTKGVETTQ